MWREFALRETQIRPYYIILPKGAISPTNSIYRQFDILYQGHALWSQVGARTIRSAKPFKLSIMVNNKIKELSSRKIKNV